MLKIKRIQFRRSRNNGNSSIEFAKSIFKETAKLYSKKNLRIKRGRERAKAREKKI